MDEAVPRSEYPRPQFVRRDWLCLNGDWEFEIDFGDSGLERGVPLRPLKGRIRVPFCPESKLSGVENVDFLNAVWYRREVEIPTAWAGRRVLLHFGAVDYDATIWVNGKEVYRHRGGFTSFSCDLHPVVSGGDMAVIVVRARDDATKRQPRGKQSHTYGNQGCLYTRTTGIWQTVWMEPVPLVSLGRPRITPDVANGVLHIDQPLLATAQRSVGLRFKAILRDEAGIVYTGETAADVDFSPHLDLVIPEKRRHLWEPGNGHLYDLQLQLIDGRGNVIDEALSYAALRSVAIDGKAVKINDKSVFQRLVLDQGIYADGILTAPTDADLIADIELSMSAGFNGARLHQKVFEERFLYHADRLGYLCWGEFADWSFQKYEANLNHDGGGVAFVTQWLEALHRDYSHPCIIGWCGMNETRERKSDRITELDDTVRGIFLAAKAMDPTRPVLDVSGYSHRVSESDVWDCHDYEGDLTQFRINMDLIASGTPWGNDDPNSGPGPIHSIPYRGQPFFNSEFGGLLWNPDARQGEDSWGYGKGPQSIDEFYQRFETLCAIQLENPLLFGYCYTQLTDVFQEQNGIYRFNRKEKFDMRRIKAAQMRVAAIEKSAAVEKTPA